MQLRLNVEVVPSPPVWCSDDWETPDEVARAMQKLTLPSDRYSLEPSAGSGQIAQFLPNRSRVTCIEPNGYRYQLGSARMPLQQWLNCEFPLRQSKVKFNLIIGNPPFSKLQQFIEGGLASLLDTPTSRLIYLLPLDWMCPQKVSKWWAASGGYIHEYHPIKGRVAYLKNGQPVEGRMRCDGVFVIKRGKRANYLEVGY